MKTSMSRSLSALSLVLLAASACVEVKELPALSEGGAGGMGNGGMGMGGMGDVFPLSDTCGTGVPVGIQSMDPMMASTMELTDFVHDLGSCNLGTNLGVDGFFTVDSLAGERWHLEVMPAGEAAAETDLSIFVLEACDERTCHAGMDQCGAGSAEHINFVPDEAGTFYFGVETSQPGSVMVMLVKPPCGNGIQQHGETCDDGDLEDRDGCTPLCQAELMEAVSGEVEPNDDALESNVVVLPSPTGSIDIEGTAGGKCDVDRFLIDVLEGSGLTVSLFDATGSPCTTPQPDLSLQLSEVEAHIGHEHLVGIGTSGGAAGTCPSIEPGDAWAQSLGAGTYSVMVGNGRDTAQSDYILHIEVTPAI
jgi:cysteine-rich repeat protein